MDLNTFVAGSVDHEGEAVDIDPRLRVGGFIGMGLLGLCVAFLYLGRLQVDPADPASASFAWFASSVVRWSLDLGGHAQTVFFVAFAALISAAGLAIATRGFSRARRGGLIGVYAVHLSGLLAAVPPGVALLAFISAASAVIALVVLALAILIVGLTAGR
jgi:hypothetical protein